MDRQIKEMKVHMYNNGDFHLRLAQQRGELPDEVIAPSPPVQFTPLQAMRRPLC